MEQTAGAPDFEMLTDLEGFAFDGGLTLEQRRAQVEAVLENQHCFRVGELTVELEFTPEAPPLQQVFENLLRRIARG